MHPFAATLSFALIAGPMHHGEEPQAPMGRLIHGSAVHLGDSEKEEFGSALAQPTATRLDVAFDAAPNDREWTLEIRQRDVQDAWKLAVNGVACGELERFGPAATRYYPIPAGTFVAGANALAVAADKISDDILIGPIVLHEKPLRELLRLAPLLIAVREKKSGAALPARITIATRDEKPAEFRAERGLGLAVRPGLAYTGAGALECEVPEGRYVVSASRGAEWSLDQHPIALTFGGAPVVVELALEREVDTTGFVAVDTHVHTVTYSGHGDASVDERVVTLAGEGVELAIATDHNHQTDYRPLQSAHGLDGVYKAITGNEVTTDIGHFNAFPLDPNGPVPDWKLDSWVKLVADMRAKGAEVVILNHPRWPKLDTSPFGAYGLDPATGGFADGRAIPVDATELVNSTALQDDPLLLFRDWFALLNRGEAVRAVGSSDSHTVGDPVGQGRTYVQSATDDPAAIDVTAACAALREGRSSISLGMFADVRVADRFGLGALVPCAGQASVPVRFRVRAPSWVRPNAAYLFADGTLVARKAVPSEKGRATDVEIAFDAPVPGHDVWLVCIALGEGVKGGWWPTQKDYTLAATNPVYLDGDGDGQYAGPRATARARLDAAGPGGIAAALAGADDAVAVHVLDLAFAGASPERRAELAAAAAATDPAPRPAVAQFLVRLTAGR